MANISIGYFLEDIAQEGFFVSLVKRIAAEEAIRHGLRHRAVSHLGVF